MQTILGSGSAIGTELAKHLTNCRDIILSCWLILLDKSPYRFSFNGSGFPVPSN